MKRFLKVMGVLSIAMVLVVGLSYGQSKGKKVWNKAMPNISFPIIFTDLVQDMFQQTWVDVDADGLYTDGVDEWILLYQDLDGDGVLDDLAPIEVTESILDGYGGDHVNTGDEDYYWFPADPITGCAIDVNSWDVDGTTILLGVPDGIIDDADATRMLLSDFLAEYGPWFDQPTLMSMTGDLNNNGVLDYLDPNMIWNVAAIDEEALGGANSWQADWWWTGGWRHTLGLEDDPNTDVDESAEYYQVDPIATDDYIYVDFIDWGNPLENIEPVVGQRFPVEITLHAKIAEWGAITPDDPNTVGDEATYGLVGDPMTIFKMACLENPSSKDEIFGTSINHPVPPSSIGDNTFKSAYASVITNKFICMVWCPDGSKVTIPLGPGIGPSGKMNIASNNGGWIPTMPGEHLIWLYVNDPHISLRHAIVNNDEHYIMSTGCKVQDLNANKLTQVGVIDEHSTFCTVMVTKPSGGKKKK